MPRQKATTKRYNVDARLTLDQYRTLHEIGEGSVAEGIRRLVDQYIQSYVDGYYTPMNRKSYKKAAQRRGNG